MGTAITIADPRTQVMTAHDFANWLGRAERFGVFYELHRGEVVEMSSSGIYSSAVAMRIAMYLSQFVESQPLGYVTGEQGGYQLSDYDVFAPDVAFISTERLAEIPLKGFAP